jgi:type VI secretion system ImpC/EvpB family protein
VVESSRDQSGRAVLLQEAPPASASKAAPSLLDRLASASPGMSESEASTAQQTESVRRFLTAQTPAEALQLWMGTLPSDKASLDAVRRVLARDIGRIDQLLNDQVNHILHHPQFQALESAWRGLWYLWKSRQDLLAEQGLDEKGTEIEIRVLSVTRRELKKDFDNAVDFDQNTLFKKVYEEEFGTAGGHPYGLLVANYEFTNHPEDIDLLTQLSGVAAAAFAPVITSAAPSLLGLDDFQSLEQPLNLPEIFQQPKQRKWRSLRDRPDAQFLGLTLPRILMRQPYLNDGQYKHGFRFREQVEAADRSQYLWGSSAWAMATVVMRAYATSGWFADIRGVERGKEGGGLVTGLPTASFRTDATGVSERSSVEVSISDLREAELCEMGFVPLSHCKDSPYSVFYSNQSVHKPEVFDDPVASANARVSAMLQYVLCCSRIAHYLKVKARDKIGSLASARQVQNELGAWLVDYITPDEKASPAMKARYPLREAEVKVEETPGQPGTYFLTIRLLPHYQLDQLSTCVTLVARNVEFRG